MQRSTTRGRAAATNPVMCPDTRWSHAHALSERGEAASPVFACARTSHVATLQVWVNAPLGAQGALLIKSAVAGVSAAAHHSGLH